MEQLIYTISLVMGYNIYLQNVNGMTSSARCEPCADLSQTKITTTKTSETVIHKLSKSFTMLIIIATRTQPVENK